MRTHRYLVRWPISPYFPPLSIMAQFHQKFPLCVSSTFSFLCTFCLGFETCIKMAGLRRPLQTSSVTPCMSLSLLGERYLKSAQCSPEGDSICPCRFPALSSNFPLLSAEQNKNSLVYSFLNAVAQCCRSARKPVVFFFQSEESNFPFTHLTNLFKASPPHPFLISCC